MREHSRFCCAFRKAGQLTASVAVRSWTLHEPQIERREHQDNSDVHHQPLPEPVPEEQDVHADHDGHHRERVDYDGCLSSHPSHLIRAAKQRQTAWNWWPRLLKNVRFGSKADIAIKPERLARCAYDTLR